MPAIFLVFEPHSLPAQLKNGTVSKVDRLAISLAIYSNSIGPENAAFPALGAGNVRRGVTTELKSFDDLMANPKLIWGKSSTEVEKVLGKEFKQFPLNEGKGWKFINKDKMVSFSEGSTRHGNSPYYKINSGKGKTKVVDSGYKPTTNEKSTIINVDQH